MRPIKDFMTPHAHTIGAEQTLEHAKHIMYSHGVRHLPVLKGGQLLGVLSDRDIKLAYAVDGIKAAQIKVGDACTTDLYTVEMNEPLKNVAQSMAERGIGCCIITDRGTGVGIFTTTDACRALAMVCE